MIKRDDLESHLAEYLNIDQFEDYCINGVQVEGKDEINKIILGVSVSQRLFEEAANRNADAIIVHHGLFWKGSAELLSVKGIMKKRLSILIKNDISLFAYHLPLDAHPEVGNNIMILKSLELTPLDAIDVGYLGKFSTPVARDILLRKVNEKLDTEAILFPFGKEKISTVAVISGGSSGSYPLAALMQADAFIGGEIKENHVREIEEIGLNYIKAGHYNSEKFGVQALGDYIANHFSIDCQFIDVPNPI